MTTTNRRHVTVQTRDGVLSWLEVIGPRGPIRYAAKLDGRLISQDEFSQDEFARRRMALIFGTSMSA